MVPRPGDSGAEHRLHQRRAAAGYPKLERYQLAFLDVGLKTTDGIALGRRLRQIAPDIVLVYISAYLEFAPQGYTVNAYRYLLKRDIAAQLPSCLEDIFSGIISFCKLCRNWFESLV